MMRLPFVSMIEAESNMLKSWICRPITQGAWLVLTLSLVWSALQRFDSVHVSLLTNAALQLCMQNHVFMAILAIQKSLICSQSCKEAELVLRTWYLLGLQEISVSLLRLNELVDKCLLCYKMQRYAIHSHCGLQDKMAHNIPEGQNAVACFASNTQLFVKLSDIQLRDPSVKAQLAAGEAMDAAYSLADEFNGRCSSPSLLVFIAHPSTQLSLQTTPNWGEICSLASPMIEGFSACL